jgi:DUF971 family protein
MAAAPQNLRVLKSESVLEVQWSPERKVRLPFRFLRIHCPCAACVNEFTGERILDPDTVPHDVAMQAAEFAGNYGLKVWWTDGHNSGIYTWDHLDRLTAAAETAAGP